MPATARLGTSTSTSTDAYHASSLPPPMNLPALLFTCIACEAEVQCFGTQSPEFVCCVFTWSHVFYLVVVRGPTHNRTPGRNSIAVECSEEHRSTTGHGTAKRHRRLGSRWACCDLVRCSRAGWDVHLLAADSRSVAPSTSARQVRTTLSHAAICRRLAGARVQCEFRERERKLLR